MPVNPPPQKIDMSNEPWVSTACGKKNNPRFFLTLLYAEVVYSCIHTHCPDKFCCHYEVHFVNGNDLLRLISSTHNMADSGIGTTLLSSVTNAFARFRYPFPYIIFTRTSWVFYQSAWHGGEIGIIIPDNSVVIWSCVANTNYKLHGFQNNRPIYLFRYTMIPMQSFHYSMFPHFIFLARTHQLMRTKDRYMVIMFPPSKTAMS